MRENRFQLWWSWRFGENDLCLARSVGLDRGGEGERHTDLGGTEVCGTMRGVGLGETQKEGWLVLPAPHPRSALPHAQGLTSVRQLAGSLPMRWPRSARSHMVSGLNMPSTGGRHSSGMHTQCISESIPAAR